MKMMPEQLRDVLESHARWLGGLEDGSRADLTDADLTRADLTDADLTRAGLTGADLTRANLTRAGLTDADLTRAGLTGADLTGANLTRADLTDAVLTGAVLTGANLTRAGLTRAVLTGANLTDADLTGANLTDANLTDADLTRADLTGANLTRADLTGANKARLSILPAGDLIGWKLCVDGVLVKLRIPATARRSNATGRKCRAEFADVLEVIGATEGRTDQRAQGGSIVIYGVGKRVNPDSWDDDWALECGHGIHFFITREEAEAWR